MLTNTTGGEYEAAKKKQDSIVISVNESGKVSFFVLEWGNDGVWPNLHCYKCSRRKGKIQGHISSTLFHKSTLTNVPHGIMS